MRDLHNNVKTSRAISPQNIGSNTTITGQTIDNQGFESLEYVLASGTVTDGTFTPTVFEGDAANMSDEAAVAAADLIGTAASTVFISTDDDVIKKIGYRGTKRYNRIKLVSTGVTTGGLFGCAAVQGHARNQPSSQGAAPSP